MIAEGWVCNCDKGCSMHKMPVNEVIELYYRKHHALRVGDLKTLIKLKQECPDIFDKKNDREIFDLIRSIKVFAESTHYKDMLKKEFREKLTVIEGDCWLNNTLLDMLSTETGDKL